MNQMTPEEAATAIMDVLGISRFEASDLLRRLAITRPGETLTLGPDHTIRFSGGTFTIRPTH